MLDPVGKVFPECRRIAKLRCVGRSLRRDAQTRPGTADATTAKPAAKAGRQKSACPTEETDLGCPRSPELKKPDKT